jgi:hypothetical protein
MTPVAFGIEFQDSTVVPQPEPANVMLGALAQKTLYSIEALLLVTLLGKSNDGGR